MELQRVTPCDGSSGDKGGWKSFQPFPLYFLHPSHPLLEVTTPSAQVFFEAFPRHGLKHTDSLTDTNEAKDSQHSPSVLTPGRVLTHPQLCCHSVITKPGRGATQLRNRLPKRWSKKRQNPFRKNKQTKKHCNREQRKGMYLYVFVSYTNIYRCMPKILSHHLRWW